MAVLIKRRDGSDLDYPDATRVKEEGDQYKVYAGTLLCAVVLKDEVAEMIVD